MNKRQKIIVSITGITLVLLILVGLTYAYFLTRIQGNTNTKSISVTTADLRIVYADGNANVITKEKIIPGTVIGEKDFTVTNEGNSESDYIVVIDDVVITNTTSGDSTTFNSNDFVYTLTCVSKNKNTNEVSGTCNSVSNETTLPLTNDSLLVSNKIAENIRHEYVLTVTYKETNEDQSEDMNKKLEAKVDIKDIKALNPYSSNTSSLAYNIINNSMLKKNGTELRAVPLTKPGEEMSTYGTGQYENVKVSDLIDININNSVLFIGATEETANDMEGTSVTYNSCTNEDIGKYIELYATVDYQLGYVSSLGQVVACTDGEYVMNHEIMVYDNSLSITPDDEGTSYYYRGNVSDNYVNFAGMCWRIVRIEGDGSVKLILEDSSEVCSQSMDGNWKISENSSSFGFNMMGTNYFNADYLNGLGEVFKDFQINTLSNKITNIYSGKNISDYLKNDKWCYDNSVNRTRGYGYDDNSDLVYTKEQATQGWYTEKLYSAYVRLNENKTPSLYCMGTELTNYKNDIPMYVATLTADEVVFAGNIGYYSYNHYTNKTYLRDMSSLLYYKDFYQGWWTLSLLSHDSESDVMTNFGDNAYYFLTTLGGDRVDGITDPRPAVTLKSGTTISGGVGTKTSPYVIN